MRLPTGRFLPHLALALLASGCGAGESAPETVRATTSSTPEASASSPGIRADRRAQREAQDAERCRELLSEVRLTFRITTAPADDGSEIGLRMTLVNRSDARLSGSMAGVLTVAPGPPSNRISWGGSSADELWQRPGTTSRREVWHGRQPPGWHPVGERVTSFDYSAYTYAPGRRAVVCHIPATVLAPRGLVDGHASGHWTEEPSR